MKKLKMTRLVLAILALFGFSAAQAISAADLQNSSVFQNNQSSATSGSLGSFQNYDNDGFATDQQSDVANYQNASQVEGAQVGKVSLTSQQMQEWKDWIAENNVTANQLGTEYQTNFDQLTASDQMTLKLYAQIQQNSANVYPTTATTTSTSTAQISPTEESLVQQWISFYIDQEKYTPQQVRAVAGFNDFSVAAQKQLLNAASGNTSTWNSATQYGKKGAQMVANSAFGQEVKEIKDEIVAEIAPDLKAGARAATRQGINNVFKKFFGAKEDLLPVVPAAQTSGQTSIYGKPRYVNTQTGQYVPEQGPQPQNYGPNTPGTLYQGSINTSLTRTAPTAPVSKAPTAPRAMTGMTSPVPSPRGNTISGQQGTTLSTLKTPVVSNSTLSSSQGGLTTTQTTKQGSVIDSPGWNAMSIKQKKNAIMDEIREKLAVNPFLNINAQPGWDQLSASQHTIMINAQQKAQGK